MFSASGAAKEDKFGVSLQANYALPTNHLYSYSGSGYGVSITAYFPIGNNFSLCGSVGDMGFDEGNVPGISSYYLNIIQLNAGLRYGLGASTIRPYIGFDTGLFTTTSLTAVSHGFFSTEHYDNTNNFALAPLLGIKIPIGATTLDITAKYTMIFLSGGGTTDYTGINAGVYFPL